MRIFFLLLALLCTCMAAEAQYTIQFKIKDRHTQQALADVLVAADSVHATYSDSNGLASLNLPAGVYKFRFLTTGYRLLTMVVYLPDTTTHEVLLQQDEAKSLEEVTIVASTRNSGDIENSPMKIEVLGKAEMSEEAGIKPGNIASILGDVSGVQIQQSSAASGNSNVRIQGLDGRYTQVLRDGMPMYDGFSGGFGILTVPPLDLQQIELIKGAASTLYGGGAIGGLVNLISKKPMQKQEADILVNYTTLKELNINGYIAKRYKKLGYTFFTGYTHQQAVDVDGNGLSDVPDVSSFLVHPKLFYYPSDKTIISIGYSGSFDDRKGGDMNVLKGDADSIHRYFEHNHTQRNTGEYSYDHFFSGGTKLMIKGNISSFDRNTVNNHYNFKGSQTSYYDEASLFKPFGESNLVAGINITGDRFTTQRPDSALLHHFSNVTTGAFAQYSWHINSNTIVEGGLRADMHNKYGLFVLPRLALFYRFDKRWAVRAGFGMGYKTPNPLVQQTIEYDLTDLLPVNDDVKAEISYGYNAEVNYKKEWDKEHSLFINQAFFLTLVDNPILFQQDTQNKVHLYNAGKPVMSAGFDTYIKLLLNSWELYLGYTYTDVRRTYLSANSFMPLTPRNRSAFVIVKELGAKWRFGLEGSYNGSQYRYDGTATPDYLLLAAMMQRNLGDHFMVVLNGENLLDARMSRVESVYTGSIGNPMFKPLWAPVDGRVINLSVRWKL